MNAEATPRRVRGRPAGAEQRYTIAEVAALLRVPLSTVYRWTKVLAADGKPVLRFQRLYRRKGMLVRASDVERVFERLPSAPTLERHAPAPFSFFPEGSAGDE